MSNSVNGECLCGAVKIRVPSLKSGLGACHCVMCRKWGGGPFLGVDGGTDVKFEGEDMISIYDSSAWAERGFCSKCGTHLFYRLKESRHHHFPAGLLEGTDKLVFDHQIFIDQKPPNYEFANRTENKTGAEVFAQLAE